jgi:hypothetical protein
MPGVEVRRHEDTDASNLRRQHARPWRHAPFRRLPLAEDGTSPGASSSGIGSSPSRAARRRACSCGAEAHACAPRPPPHPPPTPRRGTSPAPAPPSHAQATAAARSDPPQPPYDRHILRCGREKLRKFVHRYPSTPIT